VATDPAFFLGVLALLAGVASSQGRRLAGPAKALILVGSTAFVLAGFMLMYLAWDRHRFRVMDVRIDIGAVYVGRCPAEHPARVRVRTSGGDGSVVFRVWADERFTPRLHKVEVGDVSSFEFRTTVRVTTTGSFKGHARVEAPTYRTATDTYGVRCSDQAG
jgi:hypothetical protein